jgi:exodeoxyribonuclease VII small subunit
MEVARRHARLGPVIFTYGVTSRGRQPLRKYRLFIIDPSACVGESCDVADAGQEKSAEPGFDEILERLRVVVERLEGGKLTLEESLTAYEEGVSLARRGHALLDRAEKRVEVLVRAGAGGVETAPFDAGDHGDE